MPRELGEVLDFFLPRAVDDLGSTPRRRDDRPAALPIVALPIGERDVVRAAFAWNLTVEIARLGASATLMAPLDPELAPLWPEPGPGPVGSDVVLTDAYDLTSLTRAALDVAVERAADADEGGVVLVRVPPAWLAETQGSRLLLRWVLLLSTADAQDLLKTYALAKHLFRCGTEVRVGITIHGARRVDDARRAFERVARVAARHIGRSPVSYGLLVDDLHVYRAIVARRPIGLEHPQSPAARALRDVAQTVLEDARKPALV